MDINLLHDYERFNLLMKAPKSNLKYTLSKIGITFDKNVPKHELALAIIKHQHLGRQGGK